MARIESIHFVPHRSLIFDGTVRWTPVTGAAGVQVELPNIFWGTGAPWREANLWALDRASSRGASISSVWSDMSALHAFAQWLERNEISWTHFPLRKADRCLYQFRRDLVLARDEGRIAPSTATARMAAVVRFYRWAAQARLISPESPLWENRNSLMRVVDRVGLERSVSITTSDLAIRNSKAPGANLEGGVLPVSKPDMLSILEYAQRCASQELFLFLACGFYTGMRLGTIADMKVDTIENAAPDSASTDMYRIAVGPGANPKVSTKFDVTGHVLVPRRLLEQLRDYAYSVRRLRRQALALPEDRSIVFLSRYGRPYSRPGANKSSAINVEMSQLRRRACAAGILALSNFHFHQTRATFATELARVAVKVCGPIGGIAVVREALLHRSEATTLKYIKFVQQHPVKSALADEFTKTFLGLRTSASPTVDV